MNVSAKNELLFQAGINFNDLPLWQKRGTGLLWENYEKQAIDPRTQAHVNCIRRRIKRDLELPIGGAICSICARLGDARRRRRTQQKGRKE